MHTPLTTLEFETLYHLGWFTVTYVTANKKPPIITDIYLNSLPLSVSKLQTSEDTECKELWQHITDAAANNLETHLADLEEAA